MTYNVEGDSCYNDALTCSKYFEELFKKYCSDFDLAYDDGGRLDGAGGAGGAAGKQKLKPKLLTATNVGPRPINAAAAPQTRKSASRSPFLLVFLPTNALGGAH